MFGEKLRELRKSNDYSMDELAQIYNKKYDGRLNKSTISRYENGLQEPIFTVVRNFAELFNISVDAMIDDNKLNLQSKTTNNTRHGIYIEPYGDICHTIHFWRVLRHASIQDLSRLSGISATRIKDIDEHRVNDIKNAEISLLAKALDTTEQMLRDSFIPDDISDQYIEKLDKKLSNKDLRMLEIFSLLDDIDQAEIRGRMSQMLKSEKYTAKNNTISSDIAGEIRSALKKIPINTK